MRKQTLRSLANLNRVQRNYLPQPRATTSSQSTVQALPKSPRPGHNLGTGYNTQPSQRFSVTTPRDQDSRMAHQTFPADLPVPEDDGAYNHLHNGYSFPSVPLPIARSPSQTVDISQLDGLTIIFCYPRTGAPNETVPDAWNAIPGARGCTPQACSFRDNFAELRALGVSRVFGISTQSPAYQAEVHERLHLPYDLLSDEQLRFQRGLDLPVFEWEGMTLLKRSAIAVRDGSVLRCFYPVFPPDRGVDDVIAWLRSLK